MCALFNDANHFRNHIAAALNQNLVANGDVQTLDFVFIVQRRSRDGNAADATGARCATGVSAPVRPTCTSIFESCRSPGVLRI